ncbi:PREDICTED: glutamate-1-semialdehyde 2,1-aminomutase, chloroplastic-like isoform X2 [Camelina sativa]|uniref:Glutamate-1-semialdehyde 2,1-aminomutase, chloroplastic-like isoform X2 n=1 Tax=Camelina sativa TaxID=90675 RepID=A0ABM0W7W8_CAMSA|nr:PREDICTED: glutamate-1-semialdehyde 2,1-aminomutase, chloroplastic-like isoform X2 [Camelina sativa]
MASLLANGVSGFSPQPTSDSSKSPKEFHPKPESFKFPSPKSLNPTRPLFKIRADVGIDSRPTIEATESSSSADKLQQALSSVLKSAGPARIKQIKGSKMWDIDGNEYIDYVGSWGPAIIGHADDEVLAALAETMKKGTSFGAPCLLENVLAEMVISAPYNDLEAVEKLFAAHKGEISAVILEPVVGNSGFISPTPEFISQLTKDNESEGRGTEKEEAT